MSTLLKHAVIGGYSIRAMPIDEPPPGMATIVLHVPLQYVVGKTPNDIQKDMNLPWSMSDGTGYWFEAKNG